jgi:hypothetical protein
MTPGGFDSLGEDKDRVGLVFGGPGGTCPTLFLRPGAGAGAACFGEEIVLRNALILLFLGALL